MFLHRLVLCHARGKFHRRQYRQHIVEQIRESHADEAHDHGTCRADDRLRDVLSVQILARVRRHQLGGARHFKHIVKAAFKQPRHNVIQVVQVVKLPVQRRRGQCNLPFVVFEIGKAVADRLFRLIGAKADALAAVDAALRTDDGMTVSDADRLGGTTLEAVGAALAFVEVKRDRMVVTVFCHGWEKRRMRHCRAASRSFLLILPQHAW